MRYAALLVPALAVAGLAGTAAPASASVPPVVVATGSCPNGYTEFARAGSTVACWHEPSPPNVTVVTDGSPCPAGYTEYSVLRTYRVCVG